MHIVCPNGCNLVIALCVIVCNDVIKHTLIISVCIWRRCCKKNYNICVVIFSMLQI
jgi:hypothetical protein